MLKKVIVSGLTGVVLIPCTDLHAPPELPPNALLFPKQPTGLQAFARQVLRFRGRLLRWFPERRKPRLGTQVSRPTYPEGYRLEELVTYGAHIMVGYSTVAWADIKK